MLNLKKNSMLNKPVKLLQLLLLERKLLLFSVRRLKICTTSNSRKSALPKERKDSVLRVKKIRQSKKLLQPRERLIARNVDRRNTSKRRSLMRRKRLKK